MPLNYKVDGDNKIQERMGDIAASVFKAAHIKLHDINEAILALRSTIKGIPQKTR